MNATKPLQVAHRPSTDEPLVTNSPLYMLVESAVLESRSLSESPPEANYVEASRKTPSKSESNTPTNRSPLVATRGVHRSFENVIKSDAYKKKRRSAELTSLPSSAIKKSIGTSPVVDKRSVGSVIPRTSARALVRSLSSDTTPLSTESSYSNITQPQVTTDVSKMSLPLNKQKISKAVEGKKKRIDWHSWTKHALKELGGRASTKEICDYLEKSHGKDCAVDEVPHWRAYVSDSLRRHFVPIPTVPSYSPSGKKKKQRYLWTTTAIPPKSAVNKRTPHKPTAATSERTPSRSMTFPVEQHTALASADSDEGEERLSNVIKTEIVESLQSLRVSRTDSSDHMQVDHDDSNAASSDTQQPVQSESSHDEEH